ncbi:uncharacterized protein LOC131637068 [Vicia villosa]|uniref:uncharacterized protein LOC131637068 n=1 Tax=Vicia villosa TaxID=3911 RepID=UPI00273B0D96|nr:uncharacterized protein LOC131637068 [Vicia villosa]
MYILRKGNDVVLSFRVYIDRTQHDDVVWMSYTTHRDTISFDHISLYSGWLAFGTNIMCRYFPERWMRQFGYVQIISRSSSEASLINIVRIEVNEIAANFKSRLVPEEYRSQEATSEWNHVEVYMTWFYSVSHPYMTPNAHRRPPRSAHEEILENDQVMDDHVVDLLSVGQNIMQILREVIESGLFERGGDEVVTLACSSLTNVRNALGYCRQRRSQTVRIRHTQ